MAEITTIARPYAKAAFDFAVENDALEPWTEMLAFLAEVLKNQQVAKQLVSLMPEQAAQLVASVADGFIDDKGLNLIKVMAENGRLSALPALFEQFMVLKAEHNQSVTAELVSAQALSDAQLAQLQASLEQKLARKVKLVCSVDESLMGGMIIRAGDLVIDSSIKGQLKKLSDTLQA